MKKYLLSIILSLHFINSFSQIPMAVIDFQGNGITEDEAKALTDRFRNEMFKFGQYDMMERSFMEEILDEQGFQLSGCTSDACVVEVGKLVGVEQMIGGSISKVGDVYTISTRIISVETGKILKTATYDHVGDIGSLLTSGMYKVAEKLASEESAQKSAVEAGIGSLYIVSNPAGANIYVDDNLVEGTTPKMIEIISAGSHKILLKKDDLTAETTVDLKQSDIQRITLNLTLATGKVQILVKPFETEIYLDNNMVGKSPVTLTDIPAGHHTLRFQRAHYKTIDKEIKIETNRTIKIDDELEPMAFLEISGHPPGIDALINSMNYSIPLCMEFVSGEYQLQFTKPDFFAQEQTIILQPGEHRQLHIKLHPDVRNIEQKIAYNSIKRNKWLKRTIITSTTGFVLNISADALYKKYKNASEPNPTILHKIIAVEDVIYQTAYCAGFCCGIYSILQQIKINQLRSKLSFAYLPSRADQCIIISWRL